MLDQWLPSTLASIYGWFTPTVLFVLVNLVIGTIAIASKFSSHHLHHQASAPGLDEVATAFTGRYLFRSLSRSPSLVLDRLRSFNLNRHVVELSPPLEAGQAPHLGATEKEEGEADDEHQLHLDRSQSDAHPTAGEMPPKLAVRIKKSASEKSPFAHFEEGQIVNAAAASREAADQVENDGVVGEVDARADDFINRFRQQLKLQRLDSILRYKEMLGRRST